MTLNRNAPSQILKRLTTSQKDEMKKALLEKYPEMKPEFDDGLISSTTARRVDAFIKQYAKENNL